MFLALPEIIPARKCKHQQPLLDFMKSKILTSCAYTEGCECVLAQREANQNEAKHKVAEREANKEIRRLEKEKQAKHLRVCKEERAAKKIEQERAEAERQRHDGSKRRGASGLPVHRIRSTRELTPRPSMAPPWHLY